MPEQLSKDVTELPAGRELDALIAERVMGWKRCAREDHSPDCWFWWETDGLNSVGHCEPQFSTDIVAAWQVVKKLAENPRRRQVRLVAYNEDEWFCDIAQFLREPGYPDQVTAAGPTAPLAICRAALKAVAVTPSTDYSDTIQ